MKKLFCLSTFFILTFSSFLLGQGLSEYLILIGNPGVGKSTLINSLIGENVAESGVNAGIGLTKFFTSYEHNGKFYLDTPGLADVKLREQAAREIENALKKNGKYRIFFVITLQAGRVKPEDVTTINTVMEAIKGEQRAFNVIINQLSKKEEKLYTSDPVAMATIFEQINSGKHKTNIEGIKYIPLDRNIEDDVSDLIPIDEALSNFIYQSSHSIKIASEDVGTIEVDQYDALMAEYQENMARLQEQIKIGNENYQQLFSQMSQVQNELIKARKDADEAREKAERDIKLAQVEMQEAIKKMEMSEKAERDANQKRHEKEMENLTQSLSELQRNAREAQERNEMLMNQQLRDADERTKKAEEAAIEAKIQLVNKNAELKIEEVRREAAERAEREAKDSGCIIS